MTNYLHDPAIWGLVAGTPLAAAVIYRGRKANSRLRAEKTELETRRNELEAGLEERVQDARLRAEEATRTALKSAMRTLQGLANEQQLAISRTQEKYGDREILQDLLEIDHMNSQFGRRAQSVAVLCDGWLGRQRGVASVYDVARSAKGRIRHYTRVEIRSQTSFAIVSQAVEPVALALAELLDNATSYSAPETSIDINIRAVPKGVCVIIDDAGVGMNDEEKNRASRLLSGDRPITVTDLGNPPQFGFAVIGVLARRFGFSVSVDSASPYGGVRAVVLLPEELLTAMPDPQENAPRQATRAAAATEDEATTPGGLPKRRRRTAITIVPEVNQPAGPAPVRSSEETASIMGAFQRGTRSGRSDNASSREGSDAR